MANPKLKAVAASRSPERAALAEAIERHDAAIARLQRIQAADEMIFTVTAREAVEKAAREIEEAKERAARALFEETTGGMSVAEAKAAHAAAQETLAAAQAARATLEREAAGAESEISWAKFKLDEAVAAAVRTDAATTRLVARFHEVHREFVDLRDAVEKLGRCVPNNTTAERAFDLHRGRAWEAAL